jgi:hypothetical protein
LPSRPPPAVSFQQPREPTPLFPKKHGREETESKDCYGVTTVTVLVAMKVM